MKTGMFAVFAIMFAAIMATGCAENRGTAEASAPNKAPADIAVVNDGSYAVTWEITFPRRDRAIFGTSIKLTIRGHADDLTVIVKGPSVSETEKIDRRDFVGGIATCEVTMVRMGKPKVGTTWTVEINTPDKLVWRKSLKALAQAS